MAADFRAMAAFNRLWKIAVRSSWKLSHPHFDVFFLPYFSQFCRTLVGTDSWPSPLFQIPATPAVPSRAHTHQLHQLHLRARRARELKRFATKPPPAENWKKKPCRPTTEHSVQAWLVRGFRCWPLTFTMLRGQAVRRLHNRSVLQVETLLQLVLLPCC